MIKIRRGSRVQNGSFFLTTVQNGAGVVTCGAFSREMQSHGWGNGLLAVITKRVLLFCFSQKTTRTNDRMPTSMGQQTSFPNLCPWVQHSFLCICPEPLSHNRSYCCRNEDFPTAAIVNPGILTPRRTIILPQPTRKRHICREI